MALKEGYFYQLQVGGKTIRGLSIAGLNVLRRALRLPEIRPQDWRDMTPDERHMIRYDTFRRSTPDLMEQLFGEKMDPEELKTT